MGVTQILIQLKQDIGDAVCQGAVMGFADAQGFFHPLAFQQFLLHGFIQPGIFKRNGGLIGKGGEQALIPLCEGIWRFAFHADDADHTRANFKRDI